MTDTIASIPEHELRTYFSDAPQDMSAPSDVSSLFKLRLRTFISTQKVWLLALDAIVVVIAVSAFLAAAAAVGIGAIGLLVLFWLILLIVQNSKAKNDFFVAYARARGLNLATKAGVPTSAVPLMRKGDKRTCNQAMHGTILGAPCTLANYTYTEVSTDSDGSRTESNYPYLILHVPLPPEVGARYAGVHLNPSGLTLGALQDKLAKDHAVQLESADFNKRYNLRAADSQDEVALYELFSPPFIEALTLGPKIHWQQVGTDLVIYRKKHETEARDLDAFVALAAPVVQRYREEWQ
jgi:hypothetical protein